jgi:hypothetical protein
MIPAGTISNSPVVFWIGMVADTGRYSPNHPDAAREGSASECVSILMKFDSVAKSVVNHTDTAVPWND